MNGIAELISPRRKCGTTITEERLLAAEAHFQANALDAVHTDAVAAATVPVYFHVISKVRL